MNVGTCLLGILLTAVAGEPGPKPAPAPDLKRYEAFARRVEALVRGNDVAALQRLLDGDAFVERAMRDLAAPEEFRNGFKEGARQSDPQIFPQICKAVHNNGSYKLLRVRLVDGKPRALFRMLSNGAVNYHDMLLEPGRDGEPRVVDMYIAVSGEFVSQTIRRFFVMGLAESLKVKGGGPEGDFMKGFPALKRMTAHKNAGRHREALKEWSDLPPSLRNDKGVFLMRLLSAIALREEDPDSYQKALEDFRTTFPGDPAMDLVTLDGLFLKKKYAEVHKAVDRIDRALGGDPYLDVFRANTFVAQGKPGEARAAARRAVAAEPDLVDGYWALVSVSLQAKDFADTAELLTELQRRFAVQIVDLTALPEYAEFLRSAAYRDWLARQGK